MKFLNFLNYLFSSPLWGFLYLIKWSDDGDKMLWRFSSPLWGFLYLIIEKVFLEEKNEVLVPSLGISLFNIMKKTIDLLNEGSRPLSGDFFI